MTLSIAHVTVDCADAAALAGFWSELLDTPIDPDASAFFATIGRTTDAKTPMMFIQVPDKTPGKNVIHLDLITDDLPQQVERALSLGAEHIGDFDEYGAKWTTLSDPEGNLFDIGGN